MKLGNTPQTLNEFIIQQQTAFPYAKGELTRLLNHMGVAAKMVHKIVNAAGLADILGKTGKQNIQGEDVMKLDEYANEQFIRVLTSSGEVCGLASEENYDIITFDNNFTKGGKLRLLYEANPIAFLAEQAGGLATDGKGKRILEIVPQAIHQRVPLFTGSKEMVEEVEKWIKDFG